METKKVRMPGPPGPGGSKTWSGELLGRKIFWQAETPEEADRREHCSYLAQLLFLAWFVPEELTWEEIRWAEDLIREAKPTRRFCLCGGCKGRAIGDVGICSKCAHREFEALLEKIQGGEVTLE